MDARDTVTVEEGDRYPLGPPSFGDVMELVYVLVLEAKFCEFESHHPHQVLCRYSSVGRAVA